MVRFPSSHCWWSINRTPLVPGWVSESIDGRPVGPLMGSYRTREVGTLRMRTMPNFWNHSSGDHSVSTRLSPAGPQKTLVQVQWLVAEDAVEGKDYALDALLPFWELTSEQDWDLCEKNQAGVSSSAFTPGPYSTKREYNVIRYTEWYLQEIAKP
jgi:glycine betaine catabolism A